jgi:hypothetical protein
MLARFGHVQEAAQLVKAFPEFGELTDAFGINALELIDALSASPNELPASVAPAPPGNLSEVPGENGGWPTTNIPFPGWDGQCGIAELSGIDTARNPTGFIRDFVLKQRPVILRDFIKHDSRLVPLLHLMTNASLSSKFGKSIWNVGSIPYSQVHAGLTPPKSTLSLYLEEVMADKPFDGKPPPYIFSSRLQRGKKSASASDLFPQTPAFIEQGLEDTVRLFLMR